MNKEKIGLEDVMHELQIINLKLENILAKIEGLNII
jgi:hypothetical protein